MRVLRWAAEPYAQGAGERRLDDTRVRTRMAGGVAVPRAQRGCGRTADHRRAERDENTCQARGDHVQRVIEFGCGPTESLVSR